MGAKFNLDGVKVRALRTQRGWTQEQLAEIAGISPRTIQRVETLESAAYETVRAIAGAFDLDFDQLLRPETQDAGDPVPARDHETGTAMMAKQAASPPKHSWLVAQVAAGLAVGLLAGAVLTHQYQEAVKPHSSTPVLNVAMPMKTEVDTRTRVEGGALQVIAAPEAVPGMASRVAFHEQSAVAEMNWQAHPPSAAVVAELSAPATPLFTGAADSVPRPAYLELPLRSRDMLAALGHLQSPLRLKSNAAFPDDLPREGQDIGAVRQAMGQAGRKMGEALSRISSSMKRVF